MARRKLKGRGKNLPDNAKRVFKGEIYDVWQWEQEMYDGSKKIFEKIRRPGSAIVIAVVGDKIILQEQEQPRRKPFLSLPGGRCDKGEEAVESARRELLEETGYSSDNFVLWKEMGMASTMEWKKYYYIAKNCKYIQEPEFENGEKIKNKLIDFNEFLMLSEEETFRDKDLIRDLLYFRLHPEKQEEFKKLLFNK